MKTKQEILDVANSIPGTQARMDYAEYLINAVQHLPNDCKILEIGGFMGGSASTMALATEDKTGIIYSIDPAYIAPSWRPEEYKNFGLLGNIEQYVHNTALHGLYGRMIPLAGTSEEVLNKWNDKILFDMIFIDGEHTYEAVKVDMEWAKYTKPNALIVFDDWITGIEKACMEYIGAHPEWKKCHGILKAFKKGAI